MTNCYEYRSVVLYSKLIWMFCIILIMSTSDFRVSKRFTDYPIRIFLGSRLWYHFNWYRNKLIFLMDALYYTLYFLVCFGCLSKFPLGFFLLLFFTYIWCSSLTGDGFASFLCCLTKCLLLLACTHTRADWLLFFLEMFFKHNNVVRLIYPCMPSFRALSR